MSTWSLRDIIFTGVLLFNAGFTLGIYFNHIRHNQKAIERIEENIKNLFSIANSNRNRISRIEGRLKINDD